MSKPGSYIEKIRLSAIGAWLAAMLVAILGFGLLKKTVVLLLVKIYEWLIELNPFRT